jgi:hypothetical protein
MALWSFGHLVMVNDKRRDDQMGVKTPADVVQTCGPPARAQQPVVKVWLHSTGDASSLTALLLVQIFPIFSVVACSAGASPVSVRQTSTAKACPTTD